MKSIKIVIAVLSIAVIGCQSSSPNFSGTFVMNVKGEYAVDYDTLILSKEQTGNSTYLINKSTGFQRIKNGILSVKQTAKDSWMATWDNKKQVLSENDLGRQIRFENEGKTLILKNSKYTKIR